MNTVVIGLDFLLVFTGFFFFTIPFSYEGKMKRPNV